MSAVPALQIRGLSKRFGRTQALEDVSLEVRSGSVHALLGANGSGKSTLIKILAGVQDGDAGTLSVGGATIEASRVTPQWARSVGLRFVHQDLGVFPTLTVAENLSLSTGYERHGGVGIAWRQVERRTAGVLSEWQISARPSDVMERVRPADRAMIAIARALTSTQAGGPTDVDEDSGPLTLILDEPTSALPEAEGDRLLAWLQQSAKTGSTVVLVSHRLEEVMSVADEVTALRDGRRQATLVASGLERRDLVQLIVPEGEVASAVEPSPSNPTDDGFKTDGDPATARIEVRGLRAGPIHDASFAVQPGEIVGLAGLLGSGRTTLLQCLAGIRRPDSVELKLDGEAFLAHPQRKAILAGVAMVPESRAEEGILPGLTIAENLEAGRLGVGAWGRPALTRKLRSAARREVGRYGVVAGSVDDDILTLSGGNQQKVLLARWLTTGPRLILLDDPSVGVDVGARAALHGVIRAAASDGAAVLCSSSDPYELVELCRRVLVLRDGRMADELSGERLTTHILGHAIHGSAEGD